MHFSVYFYPVEKTVFIRKDQYRIMAGSSFGNIFRITTWGESHGKGVGVVVDGCPAGLPLRGEDIQQYLNRRKPGQNRFSTPRKEDDAVEILSGIFEGRTTGTPISMVVFNKTQRSQDYSEIASYFRPGHADYTFQEKYGFRDYRGGGRSSGRETIGRVAGGAVAARLLEELGIHVQAYAKAIGPVQCETIDMEEIWNNALFMPDAKAAQAAQEYLNQCMANKDSAGGIIECSITGMPAGIGDTVFDKLEANLAKSILSIGAVRGFEIGDGFSVSESNGSTNNDPFRYDENGALTKLTNHAGGTLGGMSDGSRILFRAAVKPTPSISREQQSVNKDGENVSLSITGRHDPVIVPRAVVVVEAMAAITIVDLLFTNMCARMDKISEFYQR